MVLDLLLQKNSGRIIATFGCVIGYCLLQCTHVFGQPSSVNSSVNRESAEIIFLKDRPAPKTTILQTIRQVKAKPPLRNFSVYGIDDGLALQSVVAGFKDHSGNLWFGTAGGGVSKFDGSTFTNFDERHGVGNGVVRAIGQDRAGNFYFGTRTGLSVYDGEQIKTYYVNDGLPAKPIVSLIVDTNDNVWFGTMGGGLLKFDGKKFTTYTVSEGLLSNTVRSLEFDKKGLLWVGTAKGVMTFDGNRFEIFKTPNHRDKTVYDIHQDSKGTMWFACGEGILKYSNNQLNHYSIKDGVSDLTVLSIGESKDGVIWFGTLEGGVTRFDGVSFEAITTSDGLPSSRIWAFVTDAGGNLWFCTQGSGVTRYNGDALVSFTTQQGLAHNLVWSIAQDPQGTLWFGHDIGFSSFDGEAFRNVTSKDTLFHFFAIAADSKGIVWGGGRQGLIRWDGKTLTQYAAAQGIASTQITDIVIDKSDVIWIATEEGVSRFDGSSFTNFVLAPQAPDRRVARVFLDRNQTLWASTTDQIFRYNGSVFEPMKLSGLPKHFTVTAFVHDKQGYYWFSSRTGLVRYDGKDCTHFTYDVGLPNDHIFDMEMDPLSGDLWMGTNLGLIKLAFKDRDNKWVAAGALTVANDVLKSFEPVWIEVNRRTGYPLDDLNHPALFITTRLSSQPAASSKSLLWAGFADKFFRFDPTAEDVRAHTAQVSINHLKLDGRIIPWNTLMESTSNDSLLAAREHLILGKALTPEARQNLRDELTGVRVSGVEKFSQLPMGLVLPHTANHITFDFGVIQTSQNVLINYQYRLRGQQEEWSYPSNEKSATFTNPWEGSYVFEVRAQSPNGMWSKPATFSFSVLPPWWRTLPMYGVYLLGFVVLLFVFVKLRERTLRAEKQTLEKVIGERTNEVMEQMRSAEMQKREAQKQKLEAERQRMLVEEKNAEIAKQLADTEASLSNLTLQMIQRFHSYSELELELKRLADANDAKNFQRAFSLITMNKSLDKEWEQFNFYFNGIYKDFNNKLREQSQQLSNYDLRMCALIKMGLENREIAMLLNIEVSSVKMAKYRLKKKFNIDESVSLRTYFETL